MRIRLKICDSDLVELRRQAEQDLPREAGAFALAGYARWADVYDVLVRRVVSVPPGHYILQAESRLELSAQAINGLLSLCEINKCGALLCHSHPCDTPYSASDDHGEARVVNVLRPHIPADAPTGSLLFVPGRVRGRLWLPGLRTPAPIAEIVTIGRSITSQPDLPEHGTRLTARHADQYDRQIRAFGAHGQQRIAKAKVGIVGLGGTGSAVAEQLVRLGVRDFVLIDPDRVSISNVTRVYGSYPPTLFSRLCTAITGSEAKAIVAARNLRKIGADAAVRWSARSVVEANTARLLLDRDVVFLCTDDHWGRSIVDQIVHQYLIPAINLGVQVRPGEIGAAAGSGVVDVLRPGQPCLWCKQFLDPARISAESMPEKDRLERRKENYVNDIDTPAPSVVSLTTTIAGMGVTLFLQLLTDFMGEGGAVQRLNWNLLDGTVRRGTTPVRTPCVCMKHKGFGDLHALPTIPSPSRHL